MKIWAILTALILSALAPIHPQTANLGTPPLPTTTAPKSSPPTPHRLYEPDQWIDTTNRAQVRNAFLNDFLPTADIPIEWTGNHDTGDAGDISLAYKQGVIQRVNFFRALAGVPAWIQLNLEFSAKAQQAALMMSVNKMLSHFPTSDWMHFTADGAEAARNSNICILFNFPADPGCVAGYIKDSGQFNSAVGHRRWILNPPTREMGTGDVPQKDDFWFGNSLWVFDDHLFDPRPPTRDGFVAWPPPGYVPQSLVFARWSFSYPNADFSSTAVAMERGGQPVSVTIEPLSQGFGENTIVWVPAGQNPNAAAAEGDLTTKVTVSNVVIDGAPRTFTYDVISFDPAVSGGTPPNFTAAGLVNSASFTAGALASEAWADLFGTNFAPAFQLDSALPESINGVRITIQDRAGTQRAARLHFVSPDRIQFVTPLGMAPGSGMITVTNSEGQSASASITIAATSPGIFSANASGEGPAAAIVRTIDGASDTSGFSFTLDTPRANAPISIGPGSRQVYVSFFGTGFRNQRSVTCRIDGIEVPVLGAVAQGEFAGLDQVNVGPLPQSLAGRGEVEVIFLFDGIPTNPVTVSIQ